jgi:hypothetical protein
VRCVYFDPISKEEYGQLAEEAGEPDFLPQVCVLLQALQQSDTEENGATLVSMSMFETALLKTENETNEPWQKAIERGWST